MTAASASALADIPDFEDAARAMEWTQSQLQDIDSTYSGLHADRILPVTTEDITLDASAGIMATVAGRRFALATLLADWVCYPNKLDRADYPHLQNVLSTFPAGFRVWMAKVADGRHLPIGYSGWHPIPEAIFFRLHDHPASITSRLQIQPIGALGHDRKYAYIYNCSIIKSLQKTAASRRLLSAFAADIRDVALSGLTAIAVSLDGQRVVMRFGLRHRGSTTHDGQIEESFAWKADG